MPEAHKSASLQPTPGNYHVQKEKEKMSAAGNGVKRIEVRAKMSGVFYRKPAPDQPPYVEVGSVVKKKQVLALLETMKVFQPIKSPANGKIVEIVPEDESTLKDEDLMFVIEVR
jgi:acetyl-CoA carboxylase biotin carboxyl carrier protein